MIFSAAIRDILLIILVKIRASSIQFTWCVSLNFHLKLEISVITEPIGFYSLGNIPTGPVMVLSYRHRVTFIILFICLGKE